MYRLLMMLCLALYCASGFAQITDPAQAQGALQKARAYYDEKSWQLAIQTIDGASTASLPADERRHLAYLKAMATRHLRPYQGDANELFEAIIKEDARDVWAGRAHWRLQAGLNENQWLNVNTSAPLEHLRAADRILTDLKPGDLSEFYNAVIYSNLVLQHFPEKEDREYVLSFIDKMAPLSGGNDEKLAMLQLRRQDVLDAQNPDRKPEERLAAWRGIVAEFPKTLAASSAQWKVCQFYIGKQEYPAALYELNLLTNQFAGTDAARDAAAEIVRIKRPDADFNLPGQFLTDEKIEFLLASRNTDSVKLSAIPFDIVEELKRQQTTRLDLKDISGKATFSDTIKVEHDQNHLPTSRTVTLDFRKPGAYVLRAEAGGKPVCDQLLLISDLALAGNTGAKSYEMWTVNAKTGKPVPGAHITVAYNIKNENKWLSGKQISYFADRAQVTTDADGFGDFVQPRNTSGMFIVAANGDHVTFLQNAYWSPFEQDRAKSPTAYIYTDRPVYRPEQVVYWRAIIRDREAGNYTMPEVKSYDVSIQDPQGQEAFKKDGLTLNEFGAIDGEFTLPVGAPLGSYNLMVKQAGGQRHVGSESFRVEEYKKPEFEVSVKASDDFARIGKTVKAKVEAKYLFGEPVAEGTVKYTVRRRPKFQFFWDRLVWNLDDRDLGWFEDAPQRPQTLHGSSGVIVTQGEGKLAADGTLEISFDSTVPDDELKADNNPRPLWGWRRMIWPPAEKAWDFQVEVTVTDASRRNIDASQVIPVGLKALKLAAKTQRSIVTPGDNARVEIKSLNLADDPVPTSGTLYVEKLVWNEKAKEDDITTVSEQTVAIESSGSLVMNWRVPAELHGRLRFAYITEDPFGGKSVAYAEFFAASPDDKDVFTQYQGIEMVPEKTRYTVGETACIMILSEYKDAYIWYWEDAGSGNLRKQVMPLPHRTNFITIPITEAFVPNTMIHLAAVRDKKLITDEVEFIVPPTSRVINVEVLPASGNVEPGTTGTVSIRATDEHGKPVSAELSLSVFDQAVTYIAPDMRDDIRKALYGMKRPLRSGVQASLDAAGGYGGTRNPDSQQYLYFNGGDANGNFMNFAKNEVEGRLGGSRMAFRREMAAGMPAPAMAAPVMAMATSESSADMVKAKDHDRADAPVQSEDAPEPAIRQDFRDSMYWSPAVRTDAQGRATVEIKYPDSLTTWRMVAVGLTADTRVGNATTQTIARKKILARLQAPRFFRERDQLVLSGNLHNYTDQQIQLETTLRAKGIALEGGTTMPLAGDADFTGRTQQVIIPAGGEARVDWPVSVASAQEGMATLNLMAKSAAGGDALQITVPMLPHGIDKFVAWNGTSRDAASTGVLVKEVPGGRQIVQTVSLPAERIRETSRLEIQVNPSLASAIREAIPYMIEYPYGCVEQTMSRFMPAAVAARAFQVLGYPLDKSMQEKLPKVTTEGLNRLRDMQLPGGGWGWWAADNENLQMTAYVMNGLTLARNAEVSVDAAMFDRGLNRLAALRDDVTSETPTDRSGWWYSSNLHSLMYAEYVLTLNGRPAQKTLDLLWARRDELTARGLAMLARTMHHLGRQPEAELVLRNMANMAVITPENKTMHWGKVEGAWWWYDDAVEATAVGLMAYLEIRPDDPVAEQAMKWLVLNRQGNRWKSTRDTANGVLALTQYMLDKKEAAKPVSIEVRVGDRVVKTLNVTPQNFWDFDGRMVLRGTEIPDGDFPVTFTVTGEGVIYYSVFAEYFTLEENIARAGNEIYVVRSYEKLAREETSETVSGAARKTYKDKWLPLADGDALKSGDEIRVTLKIKSLNDYEYIVFEDPKPAGMEPVDLQSGSRYGDGLCSNMELRDKWVAFFITTLSQGEHTIQYNMRAEIPGTFHTMPTTGHAMYFPPLRANSDEMHFKITD